MNREEWLEKRKQGLGGTDTAAVLGLNKFKGPYEVYLEKLGLVQAPADNVNTMLGRLAEPIIAADFEQRYGIKLVKADMKHTDIPWLFGSADYEVKDLPIGFDCKFVKSPYVADKFGTEDTDMVPMEYWVQMQTYMRVWGWNEWWIGAFFVAQEETVRFVIKRDDEFIEMMLKECEDFWVNHVLAKNPPQPTATSLCRQYLSERFPENRTPMLECSDPLTREWIQRLKDSKIASKKVQTELLEAENVLKSIIGEAEGIQFGDEKITWKKSKDGEKVDYQKLYEATVSYFNPNAATVDELMKLKEKFTEVRKGSRRFLTPRSWGSDE